MAKRILIVDDSVIVRNSLRAMLEDIDEFGGIACEEAADGRQAISKARDLLPDLTILDLSMPVMNGLDAAYELKRILPAVPSSCTPAMPALRCVAWRRRQELPGLSTKPRPTTCSSSSVRCLPRAPEDSSEALSLKLFQTVKGISQGFLFLCCPPAIAPQFVHTRND